MKKLFFPLLIAIVSSLTTHAGTRTWAEIGSFTPTNILNGIDTLPDGNVYIYGNVLNETSSGVQAYGIAKVHSDGTIEQVANGLGGGAHYGVTSITMTLPDSTIWAVGDFPGYMSKLTKGSITWTSQNLNADSVLMYVTTVDDSDLFVSGLETNINNTGAGYAWFYNTNSGQITTIPNPQNGVNGWTISGTRSNDKVMLSYTSVLLGYHDHKNVCLFDIVTRAWDPTFKATVPSNLSMVQVASANGTFIVCGQSGATTNAVWMYKNGGWTDTLNLTQGNSGAASAGDELFVTGTNVNFNSQSYGWAAVYSTSSQNWQSETNLNVVLVKMTKKDGTIFAIEGNKNLYKGSITTDINEVGNSLPVKIYPNPTSTTVQIVLLETSQQPEQIRIFDMYGNCTIEQTGVRGTNTINIANLPAGMYFYKNQKIVKQ